MVRCLECGLEVERIQWTHLRYKCTGKFKNIKEYKLVYPNAGIVSPELSKKTAVTMENLTSKYGEDRGFSVFTVWETEYKENPKLLIENIKRWWNE